MGSIKRGRFGLFWLFAIILQASSIQVSAGGGSGDPCTQAISSIPSGLHCTTTSITSSQLVNNAATPVTLVSAPGAGNVIFPFAIRWKLTYVSHPYQEPDFGGPFVWWQNNTNAFNTIAFRDGASNEGVLIFPTQTSTVAYYATFQSIGGGDCGEPQNPVDYTNQPLVLQAYPETTLDRGPVLSAAVNALGSGYAVNDTVQTTSTFDNVLLTVSGVNGSGGVTGLMLTTAGTTTAAGTGIATMSSGAGTGLTVNLTVQPGDGTLSVTIWYVVAPE